MSHVIRDGGSVTPRRGARPRILALLATFLLLSAGGVVTRPGLIFASGDQTQTDGGDCGDDSGDQSLTAFGQHDGGDDSGDDGSGDDCSNDCGDDSGDQSLTAFGQHHSGDDGSDDGKGDDCGHDGDDDCADDSGDQSLTTFGHHGGGDDSNDDGSDDGKGDDCGHDGDDDCADDSGDQSLTTFGHHGGGDDSNDDGKDHDGDDDGDDDEECANTATLTLNKVVINNDDGTASIDEFTLTATSVNGGVAVISGADQDPSDAVGVSGQVDVSDSYTLSESGPDGYDASAWSCTAGTLVGDVLTLAAGDNASCTITNDDTTPPPLGATLLLSKVVSNQGAWGGTLGAADFQIKLDGSDVAQDVTIDVSAGTHTISELQRPGYAQVGILCADLTTFGMWMLEDGVLDIAAGQDVGCIVFNDELPATLTLAKFVNNASGGNLSSGDFQLQIDGGNVDQNVANEVTAGTHAISEVPVAGYSLVEINCQDDDTQLPVTYDNGVDLALGQHVSCQVVNDADPVDLVLTKSVEAGPHVAGGDPFDYTITVDNLGPRDADTSETVTVTDRLPSGLVFVSFPSNCDATGQELTCDIDPADLEVADPAVVITVTVRATAGAASGSYTNLAFVDTPDDPACVGTDCVAACDVDRNNIDCATTDIIREASVTIDKVDTVADSVHPGDEYSYLITVTNSGPSTIIAGNMIVTDDLPAGLSLVSVDGPSPWTCGNTDPISCTYGATLDPGTSAPVITVTVKIDASFVGSSIHNVASVAAVVDLVPESPGTVVTATDDETTSVVRAADLSIDKSVSQATAAVGSQFDWIIDIANHGPDTATNVVVNDSIPASFQVVSVTPTGGLSCTNTASSVQCTVASMANGATARVTVRVTVVATATPGASTNTATVASDPTDPVANNNSDSAVVTVSAALGSDAPGTSGSGASSPGLPRTGNGSLGAPLTLAGLLVFGGVASIVIARRRRSAAA